MLPRGAQPGLREAYKAGRAPSRSKTTRASLSVGRAQKRSPVGFVLSKRRLHFGLHFVYGAPELPAPGPYSRASAPKVRRRGSDSIPASTIISVLSRLVGALRVAGGVGLSSRDLTASSRI